MTWMFSIKLNADCIRRGLQANSETFHINSGTYGSTILPQPKFLWSTDIQILLRMMLRRCVLSERESSAIMDLSNRQAAHLV